MQNISPSLGNLTIFSPEVHIMHLKLANLYQSEETGYSSPPPTPLQALSSESCALSELQSLS